MTEPQAEKTEPNAASKLSEEERTELTSAIANDIYKRANLLQVIQLVQTQCTNQAVQIVENATEEEIEDFKRQLAGDVNKEQETKI